MIIAAKAVGAAEGFVYVRAEYPFAVERLRQAIQILEQAGLLGKSILGSAFDFTLKIFEGAGAFVCGEETALIESMQGQRGIPRLKPPFPSERGLWDLPTLINNVETFALVPWIIRNGPEKFAAMGTTKSKGTKVFALAGKVVRSGLIEVPMGVPIWQVVEEIGGGIPNGKRFKAVLIGGPSGGCLPASLAHTPIDYEALVGAGAIMGSGGLIVLDEDDCMVDVARYFLGFMQNESCGQCTFCRVGTLRMLEIMDRLVNGEGKKSDLDELQTLAGLTTQGSLCGLGRTAPNPVLTTLRYFRDEYEAHIQGRCPAGACKKLVKYVVQDTCIGCTICAQNCPVDAIPSAPYRRHVINDEKCTRCDTCRVVCPAHAIEVM
jgi:NADH:ubiquinone oxidoreductase subunit F (NADH-binding)/Pyruvate/2-oxoacid:ferredoxin oxidoreductase delta subunit